MKLRTARILAGGYVLVALFFLTWPGITPFARIKPLVFGLPFTMAWTAAWIAGCVVVFWLLEKVERRHRDEAD